MARSTTVSPQRSAPANQMDRAAEHAAVEGQTIEQDKTLPLPSWLQKAYFIFPIVLYIPDAIFNYFVYSDGAKIPTGNLFFQIAQVTLWAFMSVGVVGMAYLLSVLAPWHWGHGHHIQAFFCGIGVVVATAITTWNSLAFRSTGFSKFPTDTWVDQNFPQLHVVSLTMVLVAIAPPFWGLFWAVVQPTQTGRSLRQIRESHAERLLRLEQEAELKRLKAETNAKVRAAQLRGMAQTAAAAREQASQLFARKSTGGSETEGDGAPEGESADDQADTSDGSDGSSGGRVVELRPVNAMGGRDLAGARGGAVFMNRTAAATPSVHAAPGNASRPVAAQPQLLNDADVQRTPATRLGDPSPFGARRPPTPGGGNARTYFGIEDTDKSTGTTGPRAAVRRPGDNNTLSRRISGETTTAQVDAIYSELSRELKHNPTKKEFTARLVQEMKVDEATAQKAIDLWRESRKTTRGNQR